MTEHDVRSRVQELAWSARHHHGDGRPGLVLGSALMAMALIAGLFYSFSVAVMTGPARADDRTFIDTMQRINRAIQNPMFFLPDRITDLAYVRNRFEGPWVAANIARALPRWVVGR